MYVFSTKIKGGNEFFEVKFKIAEATCVTIRIMKQANQTFTENYLQILNQEREPVTLRKLSKTPKGDYLIHPKEVLYKSQHRLTLITTKNTSKKLTSLEHKI